VFEPLNIRASVTRAANVKKEVVVDQAPNCVFNGGLRGAIDVLLFLREDRLCDELFRS